MKKIIVFVTVLLSVGSMVFAGQPFGFQMGMTIEDIDALGFDVEQGNPGVYVVSGAPRPHSAIDVYLLRIAPEAGLYWIRGVIQVSGNRYGTQLKSQYESLESALVNIYGDYEKLDRLFHDSIWNEPRDYMMSLAKDERILITEWSEKNGSEMPESLSEVSLRASASSSSRGMIFLSYFFTNFEEGQAELQQAQDGAL